MRDLHFVIGNLGRCASSLTPERLWARVQSASLGLMLYSMQDDSYDVSSEG